MFQTIRALEKRQMHSSVLSRKDFNFDLPSHLVAQNPPKSRMDARLLVYKDSTIHHSFVSKLSLEIPENTLFIVNNSKVIPSRLRFQLPTGASAEFLLLEPSQKQGVETWNALARPIRKLKIGQQYDLGQGLTAEVLNMQASGAQEGPSPIEIKLSKSGFELLKWLEENGEMPLPPYIERKQATSSTKTMDKDRYQTVYAKEEGSVAAPTAGLHFTNEIINSLKAKNCKIEEVTLHVGAGTFLPVKSDAIVSHHMHSERFLIPKKTLAAIDDAKKYKQNIIVVGTTALRCLEGLNLIASETQSSMDSLADQWLRTSIFIWPKTPEERFKSWCANALMTNFHQPESTLLMLVSALAGYENIKKIYTDAIKQEYRFFSYGDSSLLWL